MLGARPTALVLSLVLTALVGWLDLFGLKSAAEEYSSILFYNLSSSSYPSNQIESVEVVLIDDVSLQQLDADWPMRFGLHTQVLLAIADAAPKAIFYDLLFIDARPDPELSVFIQAVTMIADGGVQIFFADAPLSSGESVLRAEFVQLIGEHANIHAVNVEDSSAVSEGELYLVGETVRAPAIAIHQQVCGSEDCVRLRQRIAEDGGFQMRWASPPHPSNCDPTRYDSVRLSDCRSISTGLFRRVAKAAIFGPGPNFTAIRTNVPYHRITYANEVLVAARRAPPPEAVFIGVDLLGINDQMTTPLHNRIPGVSYHAMAFDNLISLGHSYIRPPWPDALKLLLELGVMIVSCLMYFGLGLDEERKQLGNRIGFVGFALLAPVILTLIIFFIFHRPPVDSIGVWGGTTIVLVTARALRSWLENWRRVA